MDRKTLYHIIEWSVAFAACVFLVYKIATYDDYAAGSLEVEDAVECTK